MASKVSGGEPGAIGLKLAPPLTLTNYEQSPFDLHEDLTASKAAALPYARRLNVAMEIRTPTLTLEESGAAVEHYNHVAEGTGFEPARRLASLVFETSALPDWANPSKSTLSRSRTRRPLRCCP